MQIKTIKRNHLSFSGPFSRINNQTIIWQKRIKSSTEPDQPLRLRPRYLPKTNWYNSTLRQITLRSLNHNQVRHSGGVPISLTLQPACPNDNAIALPIPLEPPVTITTGATTSLAVLALACSRVVTWALTPACTIHYSRIINNINIKFLIRLFLKIPD